jgi:hypothetical protein
MIQFGLCLFQKAGDGYTAHPFNFYVFPTAGDVVMEGEAIAFNRDHGMDFQKWITQGIG